MQPVTVIPPAGESGHHDFVDGETASGTCLHWSCADAKPADGADHSGGHYHWYLPALVLAAVFNRLTLSVLRGYVFALMWFQTWPLLYAILNSAMTFYAKQNGAPVVLSELSQIQLKYSDLASTAGYISVMIPPLSWMMVKALAQVFQRVQPFRFLCYQPDCQCGR